MDLNHPERALFGANRARVLRVLATLAEPATGRRIFELSGNPSLGTTQHLLDDLVDIGIVAVRRVGNSHAYRLNREHALWPPIFDILATPAVLETRIAEVLNEELGEHPAATALFGSFARGEAGPESDIDVVVVWKAAPDADIEALLLESAADRIQLISGNRAQLITLSSKELESLVADGDPLAVSLRRDARQLTGEVNLASILKGAG